jgi:phosphoribosyl 1,2-cyclic phosphate phosphodiesterase
MLRIQNKKLDAVLFTHPHRDHIGGLDDIRPYNFFQGTPIDIYANALTEQYLRKEFYYAFEENKYPGLPEIVLHTIDETPFKIGNIEIIPILVWHSKMHVYGYRIGNFTYITDANKIDDNEKEKIKGSEIFVVNTLRKEKHLSHFTLEEGIALSQELGIKQTYFTHISHQLGLNDAINNELPDGICLAYDGLTIKMK